MKPSSEWGPADALAMIIMLAFVGFVFIALVIRIHEALA